MNGGTNVNHFSMYATFAVNRGDVPTRQLVSQRFTPLPGTLSWNTITVPAQTGIKLEILACYTIDELRCGPVIGDLTNLTVPVGNPDQITEIAPLVSPRQTVINTIFSETVSVKVTDARGNPVPGATVVFEMPASYFIQFSPIFIFETYPSGFFPTFGGYYVPQLFTTTTALTGPDTGIAVSPVITANYFVGQFTFKARIVGFAPSVGVADIPMINTSPAAPNLQVVDSTNNQQARLNEAFPLQLQVDAGAPNVSVTFEVPNNPSVPGGTFTGGLFNVTTLSNASGIAQSTNFFANSKRNNFNVIARAPGYNSAIFTMTNLPGVPTKVNLTGGNLQSARILETFTSTLTIQVEDASGSTTQMGGYDIAFTAPPTAGVPSALTNVSDPTSTSVVKTTNASGIAIADFFANDKVGTYNLVASVVTGTASSAFTLTNKVGGPDKLVLVNPVPADLDCKTKSGQCVKTATALTPFPLQVKVLDVGNNPIPGADLGGQQVQLAVITGTLGSSARFGAATTTLVPVDAAGIASFSGAFTANCLLGNFKIDATIGSASKVTFNVNIVKGEPARLVLAPATASVEVAQTLATAVQGTVYDACTIGADGVENVLDNRTVTFQAPATGASGNFSGAQIFTTTSNASGQVNMAPYLANTVAGNYALPVRAYRSDLTVGATTNLNLTNTPAVGIAPTISTVSGLGLTVGTPLTTVVKTAFPVMTVTVTDQYGNPRAGDTVTTVITPVGAGTATVVLSNGGVTNAAGKVTATFTANNKSGKFSTVFTVNGLSVTGFFENMPGAPNAITIVPATTAGTPQTAVVNTNFNAGNPFTFDVKDVDGNLIPGQVVNVAVNAAGLANLNASVLLPATITTNAAGAGATPALVANNRSGTFNIALTAGAATSSIFLRNNPGAAVAPVISTGSGLGLSALTPLVTTVGTAYPVVTVFVGDSFGNARPGDVVTVVTNPAGGADASFTLNPAGGVVPANGQVLVTFTANSKPGAFTATATANGLNATVFLQNNVGAPADILITPATSAGSRDTVTILTAHADFNLTVVDALLNPVGGGTIGVAVVTGGGGAGLSSPPPATLAVSVAGTATLSGLTANNKAGNFQITLTRGAVTKTIFLKNNPGAAVAPVVSPSSITNPLTPLQTAINTAFTPVIITIQDNQANPIAGATVTINFPPATPTATFTLTGGGVTNAAGQVTANFTAGTTTGTYTAVISTGGPTTTINLENQPGALADIIIAPATTAGAPSAATIGQNFNGGVGFTLTAVDASSNPIAGLALNVTGATGGGAPGLTAAPTSPVTTNGSGVATTSVLKANNKSGDHTVTVSAGAVSRTIFLRNNPGAAASIVVVPATTAGARSTATVNTNYPSQPFSVEVQDGSGNKLINQVVTVAVPGSGASTSTVIGASINTGATGTVNLPTLTANTVAGDYQITLTQGALTQNIFFHNNPDVAVAPVIAPATTAGTPLAVKVTQSFGAITLTVVDSFGNPIAGRTATFVQAGVGNATVAVGGVSNAAGVINVTATAGTTVGAHTVTFTVDGQSSTLFLRNDPGDPASATFVPAGNTLATPYNATINTAFAPITMTVFDASSNPVPGATLNIAHVPGVGSINPALGITTITTDGSGKATLPTLTANGTAGAHTITIKFGATLIATIYLNNTP